LPHAGNLRPEPQQVHSKYNPRGRRFDSAQSAHGQRRNFRRSCSSAAMAKVFQRIDAASCSATRRWPSAVI
jgi:hypothetical protein